MNTDDIEILWELAYIINHDEENIIPYTYRSMK